MTNNGRAAPPDPVREALWADLLAAAARLIAHDPAASSFARRDRTCLVAIWPDAKHDLSHWPPPWVIRLET